jgi:hypothetical protein
MESVRLDGELLRALLQSRLPSGIPELLARWDPNASLHRSTVYRWLKGSLPQSTGDMLRLCSILDVDPFALVVPSGTDFMASAHSLVYSYQNDHWKPALAFMKSFLGRRPEWPPQGLAKTHFAREWHVAEITHEASTEVNVFATFAIESGSEHHDSHPHVCHFAYRSPASFGGRWLHYGYVQQRADEVKLAHIGGHFESYRKASANEPACVQTFFGPSLAQFRVASLHPFRISRQTIVDPASPRVRFPA